MVSGNSSTKKKIKDLDHILTKSNNSFLNERVMLKVLFWSQIKNMPHSLEPKIQVVILMTKYESPVGMQQYGNTSLFLKNQYRPVTGLKTTSILLYFNSV